MSESEPKAWFLKVEDEPGTSDGSGSFGEETQLSEAQLERELRRAGDRLRRMYVRQANSEWYPAKVVLKKFDQLAQEGIYIRHDGRVQGPFTAMKSIQVLGEMDLAWTDAKIGIHSDWISAERLLHKLKKLREKKVGGKRESDSDGSVSDSDSGSDQNRPAAATDSAVRIVGLESLLSGDSDESNSATGTSGDDAQTITDASDEVAPKEITPEVITPVVIEPDGTDSDVNVSNVTADSPANVALELVLVAEPVVDPVAPVPPPPPAKKSAIEQTLDPVTVNPTSSQAGPRRPVRSTNSSRSGSRSGSTALVVGVAALAIGSVIGIAAFVFYLQEATNPEVASSNEVDWTAVSDVDVRSENERPPVATQEPPRVASGMLFRPSISTTFGDANGGTLFAARVGRSNRMVLIGAAHLLGPATGLPRQLRGAEFAMFFRGLRTTDCVSGRAQEVTGKPVRLRTAEYPSISVHGDALAFEPDGNIGLDPLPVTSSVPKQGDPIWLLAPARGTDQLAHSGRWIGQEEDWYLYRLDNQSLDLVGTSGGAIVNANHEVVGIHVAGGETADGVISIASPIQPIISEIR